VCIASRLPFAAIDKREFCEKGDARHIAVTFAAGVAGRDPITVHNFYVPAGGDEPDPLANPKFAHKLAFLDEMTDWLAGEPAQGHSIVVGDLNVAPLETDVWNHKSMLKIVSHTPIETEKLTGVMTAGAWVDAMRRFVPAQDHLFTWWSYRSPDWEKANKGRRLDHVWASEKLAGSVCGMEIVKEARGWERPSDHAPVLVDIDH
jgi:exodeoxyribonuclease-3